MQNWKIEDVDRRIASDLRRLLPDRIFDFHAHIYRVEDLGLDPVPPHLDEGPDEASIDVWRQRLEELFGTERLTGGLFFPFPTPDGDVDRSNEYLIDQLEADRESSGLILITPDMPESTILRTLEHPRISGFKPYHVYSADKPTFEASIYSFLPERILKIADQRKLIVMLHIVKHDALANEDNRREIREICTKYPDLRLVLAHAARGFHASHTTRHIRSLRGLENVWFDTSGICEPDALHAILEELGPRKLLFGTDFPVSHIRGKSFSLGEGFFWLYMDTVDWNKSSPATTQEPTFVGLESARALFRAADYASLNQEDLKDIFHRNAERLLDKEEHTTDLTHETYRHAKRRIPGGTQLLSKRPEQMAPELWPAYFQEARGCETWDLDGKHYYDLGYGGIGSCLLGFRDPDVTRAVKRVINRGSMSTLNPPEEVDLADKLCEIHPWAEQVRFSRAGGETAMIAVRIARATTDRSKIAICGYHGWHDWYLAANLGDSDGLRGHLFPGLDPYGDPRELRGTTLPFAYNDREALLGIVDRHGDDLAAIIMEPCRHHDPDPGFLETVQESARKVGALLIFDEITIGFRLCYGGSHLKLGIYPDIAIFAKALGNGHPIGAIIGTREAMEGAHKSFISSTYFTERVGPAAALATLSKLEKLDVHVHAEKIGNRVMGCWKHYGEKHGLPVVTFEGYPCLGSFRFDHEKNRALTTLYTQLMLERGFLCGSVIYVTAAHDDAVVDLYAEAIDEVFAEIAKAIASGKIDDSLRGPVAMQGFRRLL